MAKRNYYAIELRNPHQPDSTGFYHGDVYVFDDVEECREWVRQDPRMRKRVEAKSREVDRAKKDFTLIEK